jgi:hypothetical protein
MLPAEFSELVQVLGICLPKFDDIAHGYFELCTSKIGLWYIFASDSVHFVLAAILLTGITNEFSTCSSDTNKCCEANSRNFANCAIAYYTFSMILGYWRYCGGWALLPVEFILTMLCGEANIGAVESLEVASQGTLYMFCCGDEFDKERFRKVMALFRPWKWVWSIIANAFLLRFVFDPTTKYISCTENFESCTTEDFNSCSTQWIQKVFPF